MNKITQIIILDDTYKSNNNDYVVLNESVELIDEVTIKLINGDIYNFDYLIFTNTSYISNFRETNILHDSGLPVTNFYHQTTYENIYYFEDVKNCLDNIFEEEK